MATPPPVVWINGYPGTGKLTVSRKIVQILGEDKVLLIDNHQLIDPVKVPREHPDYKHLRKLERTKAFEKYVLDVKACPKIIIFTDFQTTAELGTTTALEYPVVARQAGRSFLPVYLHCDKMENLQRVNSAERVASGTGKLLSQELLMTFRNDYDPFRFEDEVGFDFDVTSISPQEAAEAIISHIQKHTKQS